MFPCSGGELGSMRALPLIIIVGADDLALRVCEELCATQGHEVLLLSDDDPAVAERARTAGATFVGLPPNEYESLRAAGILEATSIMPVSPDDRLNLQVALKARDLNPDIRIVLRQFNRTLGRKIEQNVANCTAVSPAAHAAASYAAAAVDPACTYAIQFPDIDGDLVGFSQRRAEDFGVVGIAASEAERRISARIVCVNGDTAYDPLRALAAGDRVIAFGPLPALEAAWPKARGRAESPFRWRLRFVLVGLPRSIARREPLLVRILIAGAVTFTAASLYFMWALRLSLVTASYFVTQTMAAVGYGDITPYDRAAGWPVLLVTMAIMLAGVSISGVFIASIASALSRAQIVALQGLRHIHAEDHVVVCGAGNVGSSVIDLLLRMRRRVVVIEQNPSSLLIEMARDRRIELLTGDATNDETLGFCDLATARSFVAVTNSDTANLEAVLGARVINPALSVVMRVMDRAFARSVERNFTIAKSFSTSELAVAMIAGLSRFPGTRGRVAFEGGTYDLGERPEKEIIDEAPPPAGKRIPLYVRRDGRLVPLHDFSEMKPDDRVLFIVSLSQGNLHPESSPEAASR